MPISLARIAAQTALATVASSVALLVLAGRERKGALQPLNATSHWLNGRAAASGPRLGWRTTGVGFATHLAATGFWAAIYETWLGRGRRRPVDVVGKAAAMAGLSVLVDYTITPKRFTPGWESVLSPRAMAITYLALGGGLAAGGWTRRAAAAAAADRAT